MLVASLLLLVALTASLALTHRSDRDGGNAWRGGNNNVGVVDTGGGGGDIGTGVNGTGVAHKIPAAPTTTGRDIAPHQSQYGPSNRSNGQTNSTSKAEELTTPPLQTTTDKTDECVTPRRPEHLIGPNTSAQNSTSTDISSNDPNRWGIIIILLGYDPYLHGNEQYTLESAPLQWNHDYTPTHSNYNEDLYYPSDVYDETGPSFLPYPLGNRVQDIQEGPKDWVGSPGPLPLRRPNFEQIPNPRRTAPEEEVTQMQQQLFSPDEVTSDMPSSFGENCIVGQILDMDGKRCRCFDGWAYFCDNMYSTWP